MAIKVSRKRFNDEAKKLKRKQFLTAADARDQVANKYGYPNFDRLEADQLAAKEWK